MPLKLKNHTKRQHRAKKSIQTKKLVGAKKQEKVLVGKPAKNLVGKPAKNLVGKPSKNLVGKGRFDLIPEDRAELVKKFKPIFDLNEKNKKLAPDVLSSAIDKIIEKARLYITKENLHSIDLHKNNSNKYSKVRKSFLFKSPSNPQKKFTSAKIEYYQDMLKNIISGFEDRKANLTISQFNVISLQFVLLFTEIILQIFNPSKGRVAGFEEELEQDFKLLSKGKGKICNYQNYNDMYDNILYTHENKINPKIHNTTSKQYTNYIFSAGGYYKIIGYLNDDRKIMPYKNELIPGMFIILFLGEIEPNDLTKAFIQEYYVLGMTMEMEYADTYYATPLGFILHDIQHRNNRLIGIENLNILQHQKRERYERAFMNYVETTSELTDIQKNDIYLVLFLAIHETNMERLFTGLINDNFGFGLLFYFTSINIGIMTDVNNWVKKGVFNELLPDDYTFEYNGESFQLNALKNASAPYNNEEELKNILESYLNYITQLFTSIWNNFLETQFKIKPFDPFGGLT